MATLIEELSSSIRNVSDEILRGSYVDLSDNSDWKFINKHLPEYQNQFEKLDTASELQRSVRGLLHAYNQTGKGDGLGELVNLIGGEKPLNVISGLTYSPNENRVEKKLPSEQPASDASPSKSAEAPKPSLTEFSNVVFRLASFINHKDADTKIDLSTNTDWQLITSNLQKFKDQFNEKAVSQSENKDKFFIQFHTRLLMEAMHDKGMSKELNQVVNFVGGSERVNAFAPFDYSPSRQKLLIKGTADPRPLPVKEQAVKQPANINVAPPKKPSFSDHRVVRDYKRFQNQVELLRQELPPDPGAVARYQEQKTKAVKLLGTMVGFQENYNESGHKSHREHFKTLITNLSNVVNDGGPDPYIRAVNLVADAYKRECSAKTKGDDKGYDKRQERFINKLNKEDKKHFFTRALAVTVSGIYKEDREGFKKMIEKSEDKLNDTQLDKVEKIIDRPSPSRLSKK